MAFNQVKFRQENDIAFLIFDTPKKQVNTINQITLTEMSAFIDEIKKNNSIKAVCLISQKKDNFIAGADIHEFENLSSAVEASELSEKAHDILNEISRSPKPYVAAIHGACLGGGLEVALACHYRIATLDPRTIFAFLEVRLGLLPAAGGTQRLPRLIGMPASLNLLLSGKKINTKKAHDLGLVDFVVGSPAELHSAAVGFIQRVAIREKPRKPKRLFYWELLRLALAKKYTLNTTHGHYPAPMAILKALNAGVIYGFDAGLRQESQEFGRLIQSDVSKNLIRLFFAQKAHQNKYRNSIFKEPIIGIVGSGLMGSGIAFVSLMHKQKVYLGDNSSQALSKAQAHIWHELRQNFVKGRMSNLDFNRSMSHLSTSESYERFSHCDAVIEAIVEDLPSKQILLKKLEVIMKKNCIFASNTSSIPISEIAQNSQIKDRVIGMHYFSPVEKMPLLEIIKSKDTSEQTIEKAYEIGVQQGKTIIIVNDSPGFYTTRIIAALFDEASALLLEGHSPKEIDYRLEQLGFPLGPMALMDQVGIDVGYHVSEILYERLGSRLISVDLGLSQRMIQANFLGHKSGKGFYIYKYYKKVINPEIKNIINAYKRQKSNYISIEDRMLFRMINEAAYCLSENVISTAEDGDVGAVFGLGFPAYLGGPFKYIQERGPTKIARKLDELREHCGERFIKAPYF